MLKREMNIADYDAELWQAMEQEKVRQEEHIELIASENYTSPRVMQAQGSQLTNKYAEGYPGKRYYGGCEYVDIVEQLAIDRAKELFGADYANVQPHSGSQANFAVYTALLQPGDVGKPAFGLFDFGVQGFQRGLQGFGGAVGAAAFAFGLGGIGLLLFELAQGFVQRFEAGVQGGKEGRKRGVQFVLGGVVGV